ncbi:iron-containing redox enzyme family protein [Pseudomonas sp. WJP1]|uniref:iron-containing redox enzyme family protein n=1 Tax=Pseudomonas sp. WJP1 TaxID=2986947 RepID=UPI00234A3C2D|nr:iron-containing redox enzyme family protein [Pseudomonas sp. WJP1]WCM49237.1 iron-containing redox enzyme family protein [Pseudomonas sp. WJP1]
MTTFTPLGPPSVPANADADGQYRELYDLLYSNGPQAGTLGEQFLREQLALAAELPCDLPEAPEQLSSWAQQHCAAVARDYAHYLEERKQGGPRRYFSNKAHALFFLQRVAPTKEVDGAWLTGVLEHWQDMRYNGLLSTYLEELGRGDPRHNHVVIYRKLLAYHDCGDRQGLLDEHFRQGAIQLALGQCNAMFMPEVIGYNLGYEQLPLHLLISAYELRELGIDPYYFTLHVTIDNVSSGHGRKAIEALLELMPMARGRDEFYRRVALGYRLNDLGPGSTAVIASFDLQQEVVAMLERKRRFGQHMHSDYCQVEGKTVNQWLATPGHIEDFLGALQRKGWIKRHCPPGESRFWQLIEGDQAAMFGVFSGFEKQLLHDWIAGDWQAPQRRPAIRRAPFDDARADEIGADDPELKALQESLHDQSPRQQLQMLIPWLSAQRHCRPAGLFATRRFIECVAHLR